MQDALASNAGDRYHFVYAARRMLDMLHPRNNLELIQMENVAEEDILLGDTPETFLGVDLMEYYGGKDSDSAQGIVVVQVKYSSTDPNATWTLNRLCTNKISSSGNPKPGSSVLRKLADPFNAFYETFGDMISERFQIKLHTNQALADGLKIHLEQTQALIAGKSDTDGSKVLRTTSGDLKKTLDKIQKTTALSWKRLTAFLKSWDLSSFGQGMLSRKQAELFRLISQYTSNGIYIKGLIDFVQEHAIPNRRTDITREEVLEFLHLRENDFWPAPHRFEPVEGLLFTKAAEHVIEKIDSLSKGILLVHGVSGTGKTTLLRLLSQYYGDGKSTVIYDCFAKGAGLQPGSERFPYNKCIVQIINELDGLFHTNILATTSLNYTHLMDQFSKALTRAAQIAEEHGQRLVIAIDAVDNAVYAASRAPLGGESFVPLLWRLSLPENCILIVTFRTENLPELEIDCEYESIEIQGFTEEETKSYIRSFWNDADDASVQHIHRRTNGNPRVQTKLIEQANYELPSNRFDFVSQVAQKTTFAYYQEECPKRLRTSDDKLVLAVLLETTPFIPLNALSDIIQWPLEKTRTLIESLYFGLRISDNDEVFWKDQDFLDFLQSYVKDEIPQARCILAEYCQNNYGVVDYATLNLSRHFYMAGWYERLFNWWIENNRLNSRILEAKPYEEDILVDIQYGLLAANQIEQFTNALKLLSLAADIRQGRDVFSTEVKKHIPVAIECQYGNRLIEFLRERETGYESANYYFAIARSLAEHGEQIDLAEDLIEHGFSLIRQENRKYPQQKRGFSLEEIQNIELFGAYAYDLGIALKNLQEQWKPQETIYLAYAMVTRSWSTRRGEETFNTIESVELNEHQRAYSLLGLLSAPDTQLSEEMLRKIAHIVIAFFEKELFNLPEIRNFVIDMLENVLRQGLVQEAQDLLQYCPLPKFEHRSDPGVTDFLKIKALETVLEVDIFNPDEFVLDSLPEHLKTREDYKKENEQALRAVMKTLFPSLLCRAKTLVSISQEDILQDMQTCLETQTSSLGHWRYTPQHYDFTDIACYLLEAIIYLPDCHNDLVSRICGIDEQDEQTMSSATVRSYARYAAILSQDERYYGQAEKLINLSRQGIRSPTYRASEAVQALLELYPSASQFDRALAFNLFTDARLIASEWDGNIGGRAFAILRTASHAQREVAFTEIQLNKLATVFEYMKRVALEDTNTRIDEALRLIACINPSFAFEVLERLERSDLLNFGRGISSITLGMLDAQFLPPEVLWPLSHLVESTQEGIKIYYQALSQQRTGQQEFELTLQMLAKYIRVNIPRRLRATEARKLVEWAAENGLRDNPTIQSMQKYAGKLKEFGIRENVESSFQKQDTSHKHTALFETFLRNMNNSPQCALTGLLELETEKLGALHNSEMEHIIDRMTESLPSRQISEFIPIIEKWASHQVMLTPQAFFLLTRVVKRATSSEKTLNAVKESLHRLLTSAEIRRLTYESYTEEFAAMLHCEAIDLETRFKIILLAVTNSLRELQADNLYKLVGHLGELLPPTQAFEVFDNLLSQSVARLQGEIFYEVKKEREPLPALMKFLSDRLGDPRQTIRWQAMYALVDIILNIPETPLPLLIAELEDEKHIRWMTKREWIFFTLHHLSLRIPSILKPYAQIFLKHALNKDFPHAKIRYHAKEILLNIEKAEPGILSAEELGEVQLVNEPKKFLSRADLDHFTMIPYEGTRWSKRHGPFTFSSIDTLPYWYAPLSHCFGMHRCHVADIAYKWIVNKWGITDELWIEEREKNEGRYDWREARNFHGSEPEVETLRLYAERHGMFMAAGELIDSKPVLVERWQDEGTTQWHGWARLRAADPSLPGRLINAPPLVAENYGSFTSDYEIWRKKEQEEEFKNEIFIAEQPDWIVVAGKRTGKFDDRQFEVNVKSALVTPNTAPALTRLINSQGFVPLPHYAAYHDTVLSEFEYDLAHREADEILTENEINDADGLFVLRAWLVDWLQEMPFHPHDPKWPEHGRGYYFPGSDFCKCLKLYREPISLNWKDENEEVIAYCEIWHDYDDRSGYGSYIEGDRLVVRRGAILRFLEAMELDMIFAVTISRHRSYRSRRNSEDDYDPGTTRSYILTSEGELQ